MTTGTNGVLCYSSFRLTTPSNWSKCPTRWVRITRVKKLWHNFQSNRQYSVTLALALRLRTITVTRRLTTKKEPVTLSSRLVQKRTYLIGTKLEITPFRFLVGQLGGNRRSLWTRFRAPMDPGYQRLRKNWTRRARTLTIRGKFMNSSVCRQRVCSFPTMNRMLIRGRRRAR